ncbi:hypothetical protein AA0116_g12593 [Alternaria tenuissima]|nr:hypothetical protein AA0116_g12593 [Alternaria tenuissima]
MYSLSAKAPPKSPPHNACTSIKSQLRAKTLRCVTMLTATRLQLNFKVRSRLKTSEDGRISLRTGTRTTLLELDCNQIPAFVPFLRKYNFHPGHNVISQRSQLRRQSLPFAWKHGGSREESYGYSPRGHLVKPGQTVELKEGDKMDGVNLAVVEVEQ